MVEDRRHAVTDAVQYGGVRRSFGSVQSQMAVDVPPHPVKYFEEIGRIMPLDRKSSRKTGVNVRMRIDKARHDDAAFCIHKLRFRIFCLHRLQGTDFPYGFTVRYDCSVWNIGAGRISRDHFTVTDQQHGIFLLLNFHSI